MAGMRVKDLIAVLQQLDPELPVVDQYFDEIESAGQVTAFETLLGFEMVGEPHDHVIECVEVVLIGKAKQL